MISNNLSGSEAIQQLTETGKWLSQKNWVPATGGNFSIRTASNQCVITASGRDKGRLSADDCLTLQWQGNQLICDDQPSAETLLHTRIFDLAPDINVVLHTHSISATVLSRINGVGQLTFCGYEMQKSISGQTSHLQSLTLPILDNDQDMTRLAQTLSKSWQHQAFNYAFLVKGHGLYTWGENLAKAKQHLEGWEFLLNCELERLKTGVNYAD